MNPITSIAAHRQMAVRLPRRVLARRSDQQLMELVHGGDDSAFEVLYERHVTGVLSFCRHMLGSQEEAEEALQHAFVSVHLGILQASGGEVAFKPWVYTIARNHCASVMRGRRLASTERPERAAEISTAGLRREVEQRDDLREIIADIERLPEQQRAAFVLTELRDLSLDEVAEVLDQEPSTVKGLVFRARSTMIERREARRVECIDVRESLQMAGDQDVSRGPLRYHLDICPECSAYLGSLHRQRRLLGLALPVVPALALKKSVMASVGAGGTGAGAGVGAGAGTGVGVGMGSGAGAGAGGIAGGTVAGAAATTGASLAGSGVLAKVAIVGVLAGSTGMAAEAVRESGARAAVEPAPGALHKRGGPDLAAGHAGLAIPVSGPVAPLSPQGVDHGSPAPVAPHAPATVPLALESADGLASIGDGESPAAESDEGSIELDPGDSLELGDGLDLDEALDGDASAAAASPPPVEAPPVDPPPVDVPPVDVPPVDVPPVDVPPVDLPPVDLPPVDLPPVDLPLVEVPVVEHPAPADPPPAKDDGEPEAEIEADPAHRSPGADEDAHAG